MNIDNIYKLKDHDNWEPDIVEEELGMEKERVEEEDCCNEVEEDSSHRQSSVAVTLTNFKVNCIHKISI